MKRIFILVLLSFCFINLGFAQRSGVIDPELYDLMNSRSSDKISVNIVLKKQIDADALNVRKSFSSKEAKRKYMVEEMKYQAEKDQADVLKTLQAKGIAVYLASGTDHKDVVHEATVLGVAPLFSVIKGAPER